MLRWLWKLYWKVSGWKIKGRFPYEYKKMIMIVGPHSSSWDVVVGFAARSVLQIDDAKFLGKKELFDGPFGRLFRWLGGVPVDRSSKQGMVEQVAALFDSNDRFLLGMAPEGTRKRVDKLRTGFYHIAKTANVPILMVGLDFENKQLILDMPFFAGDDEDADFKRIINFFSKIRGKNPEFDLRHLSKTK